MRMHDEGFRLPGEQFHWRVLVQVELDEMLVVEDDEFTDGATEFVGYYQTFGVTASSLTAAAELMVRELSTPAPGDVPSGVVRDLEFTFLGPDEVPDELAEAGRREPGVHFRSGVIFFGNEPEDDDEVGPDTEGEEWRL